MKAGPGDPLDALLAAIGDWQASKGATLVEDLRLTLQEARRREWPFERAWTVAINRVQPVNSQGGRLAIDSREVAELFERRALLEEDRPFFRASYEGRPMTPREAAQRMVRELDRVEAALGWAPEPGLGCATVAQSRVGCG